jgi:hypothetical protein
MIDGTISKDENMQNNLAIVKQLFDQRRIQELHRYLDILFFNYYQEANYSFVEEIPLVSNTDSSVLFVGAFISALKDILLSGDYPEGSNGIYMRQACLRTQDFAEGFNNDFIPLGQTFFNMIGILSRPGRFTETLNETLNFIIKRLGVASSRIKVKSSTRYDHLKSLKINHGIEVEYDTEKESYYWWNYGIDGVHGEGITICILNEVTGEWWGVGNVVRILDADGRELGTESGFGHEFLLSATLNISQPLKLSKVFETFEYQGGLHQKYFAYLEAVARMKQAGVSIGDHKTNHIYKQYLKSLQHMGSFINKNPQLIVTEISIFLQSLGMSNSDLDEELQFLMRHQDRKKNFGGIVKRVGKYLWALSQERKPKEIIINPEEMIKEYLIKNGIDLYEVSKELERLKRFKLNL